MDKLKLSKDYDIIDEVDDMLKIKRNDFIITAPSYLKYLNYVSKIKMYNTTYETKSFHLLSDCICEYNNYHEFSFNELELKKACLEIKRKIVITDILD